MQKQNYCMCINSNICHNIYHVYQDEQTIFILFFFYYRCTAYLQIGHVNYTSLYFSMYYVFIKNYRYNSLIYFSKNNFFIVYILVNKNILNVIK